MKYSQEVKDLAMKMMKRLTSESTKGTPARRLQDPLARAEYYTDISKRTFRRWLKESKESAQAEDPSTRQRPKKLDSFDVDLILRTMTDMMDRREVVTLKRLQAQLSQKDLEVKRTTLCNILKAKGFVYARSQGNRKVLCERPDLQAARCSYLRKIYDVRNNKKMDVVYLDESYVNANHTCPAEWMSQDRLRGRQIPVGKGQRLILLHAIGEVTIQEEVPDAIGAVAMQDAMSDAIPIQEKTSYGFLPDCLLLYKSHSTDNRDYHTEMNSVVFEDWVEHRLLPALKGPTCVVMDNATYHSRICPETASPTMAARKDVMKEWLRGKNIPFNEGLLKPEIYELIKHHKPPKEYVVDRKIEAAGHMVLRLPPYHCDLNPIENIWGIIKNEVAMNNTSFKLADMKVLTDQAIKNVDPTIIKNTMEHVKKTEERYWENDGLSLSPVIENFSINIAESSSDESSSENSDAE